MHVAKASIYAAEASSHAAEASSLAAKFARLSTPRPTAGFTKKRPRGSCCPHLVAEADDHIDRQAFRSIESQPQAKYPSQLVAETDGHKVSTNFDANFVITAKGAELVTKLIENQQKAKCVSKLGVYTTTTPATEPRKVTPTEKLPDGKHDSLLEAKTFNLASRQGTRSTGILPEAKRSTQFTAETNSHVVMKSRSQVKVASQLMVETSTLTKSITPTSGLTMRSIRKISQGKSLPYLVAQSATHSAKLVYRPTGTLREVKRP